jgi:hypothetical protein
LPRPRYLFALAKALGVDPAELFEGEGVVTAEMDEWRRTPIKTITISRPKESVQVLDLGSEAWLDIHRGVPWPTALEVLRLLQDGQGKA